VTRLVAAATAVLSLALPPSPARADPALTGDAQQLGHIHLTASDSPPAGDLRIVELVDGAAVPVPSVATASGVEATTDWTCARQRTFAAESGGRRSAPFVATTPACDHRLRVRTPRAVSRGENVRVTIRDRWRVGDVRARLCVRPAGDFYRCRVVALPAGQWEVSRVYRAHAPGVWAIRLATGEQAIARAVTVRGRARRPGALPSILATGDSMMITPAGVLERRLAPRARVRDDIYLGSGITKPWVVDWGTLPGKQVRGDHQAATVVALGMSDVFPIGGIQCCGDAWQRAYAQRARRIMRAYSEGGRAAVVWLNLPYPRDPRHAPAVTAVNAALDAAAAGLHRVRVLDVASVFTPGGVYRDSLPRHGGEVRVRKDDGVHLTVAGARIAARAVTAELVRSGVLP
jgi:hypothetical protein